MNIFLLELFGELGARTHAAVLENTDLVFTDLVWQAEPYRNLNIRRPPSAQTQTNDSPELTPRV